MKDNGWIVWAFLAIIIIVGGVSCNRMAPCDWYDNVPQKNVPMRCVK